MPHRTLTQTRVAKLAADIKSLRAEAMLDSPTDGRCQAELRISGIKWCLYRLVQELALDSTPIRQAFESDVTDEDLSHARERRDHKTRFIHELMDAHNKAKRTAP